MTISWQPAMKKAISEVMETMFFVLINFVARKSTTPAYTYGAKVLLSNGAQRVEIVFRVTESFARMITANFLSKREDEVVAEEMEDVMKELANMVGGHYMGQIQNEGWKLGIPRFEGSEDGFEKPPSGMELSCLGEGVGVVDVQSIPSTDM